MGIAAFAVVIDNPVADKPLGCTAYISGSTAHEGVERTRDGQGAPFVNENLEAETVCTASARAGTVAGFNTAVTAILADADRATALGGTTVHALDKDSFSAAVMCPNPGGEVYQIELTRTGLTFSSFEDDAILANVETRTNLVPALVRGF
jgi:hypothetical protein